MKIPSTILIAGIAVLLMTGPSASAADKDILQLQNDVVQLRLTVQDLQKSVDAKNALMGAQMDKMADQMNNLGASLKSVTELIGTIKSDSAALVSNSSKTASDVRDALAPLNTRLSDLQSSIKSINENVTGLGRQVDALSGQVAASKVTSEPAPTCKDYKQNADRNRNSNYPDDAITGYRDFLKNCPADSKAAEVQFLIGEVLFESKKYDQAVTEYDIFLQKNPSNEHTASALLRKGLAHMELKQIADARKALTSVTTDFKGSPEAGIATSKLKELGTTPATGRGGRGNQ